MPYTNQKYVLALASGDSVYAQSSYLWRRYRGHLHGSVATRVRDRSLSLLHKGKAKILQHADKGVPTCTSIPRSSCLFTPRRVQMCIFVTFAQCNAHFSCSQSHMQRYTELCTGEGINSLQPIRITAKRSRNHILTPSIKSPIQIPISLWRVHKGHDAIWRHWAVRS